MAGAQQNTSTVSVKYKVNFKRNNGKQKLKPSNPKSRKTSQKLPHITKLLALAHHLQKLLNKGVVRDYADIACLSGLSRARVTQIIYVESVFMLS